MIARTLLGFSVLFLLVACGDQEMANMPRYEPLEPSDQFPGGTSALWPVPGTVARDADLSEVPETIPFDVDMTLLRRGRERYGIFCAPCHSRSGDGDGMIVARGFPRPPTYHQPSLRGAPDRHFYDVITNGYGAMYSYAARVPPADRWAIVAYIRTLQYSHRAPVDELPERLQNALGGAEAK